VTSRAGAESAVQTPDVVVERHGGVMLLRMNRPQRHNAVGGTLFRDLAEAFDEAGRDDAIRVVVTTGAAKSFCVGADVADFARVAHLPARDLLVSTLIGGEKGLPALSGDEKAVEELGSAGRWTLRMWALEKPTVAAINGTAVGGGFGIALLHDIRVAAASARLGAGFAAAGLAPELGMSLVLPRLVGASAAAELMFTGRLLRAEEARAAGVVSEVVPDDRLLERAMELAAQMAGMPPLGLRLTKRLLRRGMGEHLAQQLRAEYAAQVTLFDHPETREALIRLTERVTRRSDGG
jgi:enoyl-CoA hydratase/carnithine racemase